MSATSAPLWTLAELQAASGGAFDGDTAGGDVSGISIDTRTLEPGDLFVALKDQRDGHDFVPMAFDKGAGVALVAKAYEKQSGDGLLLRVYDPLEALEKLAMAARTRLAAKARVIAVTGSAGKTTCKEMLRTCFAHMGPVHASEKSYNNHWGVPLTLARMPAKTAFAVIEIGMNHPGEIRPLVKMVRPHVAVVTTVAAAHLGQFSGLEEIAEAKAEIFEGLLADGIAVLPFDNSHYALLAKRAAAALGLQDDAGEGSDSHQLLSFGTADGADVQLFSDKLRMTPTGSQGAYRLGRSLGFNGNFELSIPGRHNAINAVACIASWYAAVSTLPQSEDGEQPLAGFGGMIAGLANVRINPVGRGQVDELASGITLIDESYNANPASVRAALDTLSLYPGERRHVAILGDMLELGDRADELHKELQATLQAAKTDKVFACGPHMQGLFNTLPSAMQGGYAADSAQLQALVEVGLQVGDVVMVKGSLGSRMKLIIDAVKAKYQAQESVGGV